MCFVSNVCIRSETVFIFDYFFTNKPIIYFTYDLKDYENDRGMYFPFQDYVYGKVTITNDELIEAIKKGSLEEEKRTKFKQKFLDACDGKSTAKTYKWIFENKLD